MNCSPVFLALLWAGTALIPAIRPGKPCAGHVQKWIAIGSATFRVPEDRAPAWWMFFHFDPW